MCILFDNTHIAYEEIIIFKSLKYITKFYSPRMKFFLIIIGIKYSD